MKMAKMTNGHSVHKNKGFAPQTPENDKNGGCHARNDHSLPKSLFLHPRSNIRYKYSLTKLFTLQGEAKGVGKKKCDQKRPKNDKWLPKGDRNRKK